ncbi:MAG: hypothetical protein GY913_31105 [Proteobacteria bacterium]|nr:hypothetical protein [Pseudomonadota bacterium]MCP4921367.1 hypothetical protein [Pseudomonadota bacterium]
MIWLLACSTSEPVLEAPATLEGCATLSLSSLQTTCHVQTAADAGHVGDDATAREACLRTPEGTWRDECHFRAGEELGRGGFTDLALRHCAEAGRFARNCVTHAAWGLPPNPDLTSDGQVEAAMTEFVQVVSTALEGAPEGVAPEALDTLMSRAWFNLYVGSGVADPGPTRGLEEWQAAQARTAWAIEAARLSDLDTDGLVEAWATDTTLRGEPLEDRDNVVGRYASPILPAAVETHPHTGTFGGGARLRVPEAELDIRIAVLEGLFFDEDTPPATFAAHLEDPVPEVRWTAAKLTALSDADAELALHDEVSRAYVEFVRKEASRRRR